VRLKTALQTHPAIAQAVVHPQGEQLVAYLIARGAEQPDVAVPAQSRAGKPARLHGAAPLPLPGRLPAHPQRQGGPQSAARPRREVALAAARAYTAPRNAIEERLADIWQQLLKVPRVGVHDNFFELGGDSILAVRFIAKARENGFNFRPNQLFQNQTVADLALLADTQRPFPLTAVQHHLLTTAAEPMVLQLQLNETLDGERLNRALDILQQLPNLKVNFTQDSAGQWQQQAVEPPMTRLLATEKLTHRASKTEQAEALQTAVTTLKQRLSHHTPPHIAAALLQLPQQEMLLLAAAPLVLDRAAVPHLLHALAYAYQHGKLPAWPQTTWQEWLAIAPAALDRAYWQEMATQIAPLPTEPVDSASQPAKPTVRLRLTCRQNGRINPRPVQLQHEPGRSGLNRRGPNPHPLAKKRPPLAADRAVPPGRGR
jgi:aryl carrier-like protein